MQSQFLNTKLHRVVSMSLLIWIGNGTWPAARVLAADDLDFRLIGGTPAEPSSSVRDFRIIGGAPADWQTAAAKIDFTILGNPAVPEAHPPKPRILVYAAPAGTYCHACELLARQASQLPYTLEWKPAPLWVDAFPTLHWQDPSGDWKKWEGWPGVARFRRIFDESMRAGTK